MDLGLGEIVLLAVIFAIACGAVASRKGRSVPGWAALGFFLGPLPLIVVAILRPVRPASEPIA